MTILEKILIKQNQYIGNNLVLINKGQQNTPQAEYNATAIKVLGDLYEDLKNNIL